MTWPQLLVCVGGSRLMEKNKADGGAGAAKRRRTAASLDTTPEPAADAGVFTLPPRPAALQQLVAALGRHESDLRDLVFELACMPRYLAESAANLPPDPAGGLGTFAVTVPLGTIAIAADAFRDCAGLAQVTLPATVTVIADGDYDEN